MSILFKEDFQDWKEGFLPDSKNYSALGEMYCFDYPDLNGWISPINHWSWGGWGADKWRVVRDGNKKYLEQTIESLHDNMIFIKYDMDLTEFEKFTYCTTVIPNSNKIRDIGIVFGYTDSANYYTFVFDFEFVKLVKRVNNVWCIIEQSPFKVKKGNIYKLRIKVINFNIFCYIDNKMVIKAKDLTFKNGKIGLIANNPAKFSDIIVKDKVSYIKDVKIEIAKRGFKKDFPKPIIWKVINTRGFGGGKHLKFGDLNKDGKLEIIIPQMKWVKGMKGFPGISCITAVDLDGNILWQFGKSIDSPEIVTNDAPCQICDIDGDGFNEVILSKEFEIFIIDGKTGKIKKRVDTPKPYRLTKTEGELLKHFGSPSGEEFKRISPVGLFICNLTGANHPSNIIIKDFYHNIWVYDKNLKFLWHHVCNAGHTPAFYDFDGNKRDYIMLGYSLLSPEGKLIQSFDVGEHADGIAIGKFNKSSEPTIAIVAGGEGFILCNRKGEFKFNRIEHAQHLSIAKFRKDLEGLQYCVVTFHENPEIIYLWDTTGKLLWKKEMLVAGCTGDPVNWDGSGEELIFYSGHPEYGGLINGWGDVVVTFPKDSHPYLCGKVLDITGDPRDEIILWDFNKMYIYTQDKKFKGEKIHKPIRLPPIYNSSNFGAIVSL
jgi:hypothetical protein